MTSIPEFLYRPRTAVERTELTRREKLPADIFPDIDEGSRHIAQAIVRAIKASNARGRQFVMALGTGRTLIPVYRQLVRLYDDGRVSFRRVVVFNAYEYYPLQQQSGVSTLRQLRELLLDHVDLPEENIFSPDGTVPQQCVGQLCLQYENRIKSMGGLDLALLGVGARGNIASNEPGSGANTVSRLILVGGVARREMTLGAGSDVPVPPCSITMGVRTLLGAREMFLAAWGDDKAAVVQRVAEGAMADDVPASFLQIHSRAHVVVDLPAASRLTRLLHPWLVTSCRWTDKLTRAAVVWLCQTVDKPILKLTNNDYNGNGLSELLALHGSAYNCNIKVFNELQHTITGWPGGKPNADDSNRPERATPYPKRVLVFSPHPDDDVISMGGTLRRLVQQGHEVHVAYETSGNIAVNDEDVKRYLLFVDGWAERCRQQWGSEAQAMCHALEQALAAKREGEPDTPGVLALKTLIRQGEARTACTFNHIPAQCVHFLNLPFYESGRVEKYPMTDRDIAIVRSLLHQVQPHQLFVAGDLADPHGTHRKCTEAALRAFAQEKQQGEAWTAQCRIWMYRGAWAEWPVEDIEMCVPMSPEELRAKRDAILKHSSQGDFAPFLGDDSRLFWQRAEDRNRATAIQYDSLGLACYEAMEAFVEYRADGDV